VEASGQVVVITGAGRGIGLGLARYLAGQGAAVVINDAGVELNGPPGEPDLAARMAAQSCRFMLWQQARAAGNISEAKRLARTGIRELRKLEKDFKACWPLQNKATPQHCSAFLKWRIRDYRRSPGLSLVSSELARGVIK